MVSSGKCLINVQVIEKWKNNAKKCLTWTDYAYLVLRREKVFTRSQEKAEEKPELQIQNQRYQIH